MTKSCKIKLESGDLAKICYFTRNYHNYKAESCSYKIFFIFKKVILQQKKNLDFWTESCSNRDFAIFDVKFDVKLFCSSKG